MILIPSLEALVEQFREPQTTVRVLEDMTFSESVRIRTTEAFTAVWSFVLGATVGSFLNVVIYRIHEHEAAIADGQETESGKDHEAIEKRHAELAKSMESAHEDHKHLISGLMKFVQEHLGKFHRHSHE